MTNTVATPVAGQEVQDRRAYLQSRVDNAKRIGRPAHIKRCEERLAGFDARMRARGEGQL